MKNKIRIYESEIKRATRRKLMESYLEEEEDNQEMSGAFHRKDFTPTPREKDVMGVFGDMYGQDIPPVVIRYMRKNPDHVLRRLAKIYPEIYMRHAPTQPDYRDYSEPSDVSLDEAEEVTTKGIKYSRDEVESMKNPDGSLTIPTNESTNKLFKRFLKGK